MAKVVRHGCLMCYASIVLTAVEESNEHAGFAFSKDTRREDACGTLTSSQRASLDARVRSVLAERTELSVDGPSFTSFLASKVCGEPDPIAALADRHVGDLLLVFALLANVARAVAIFDGILGQVAVGVHHRVHTGLARDELLQEFRVHLLVDRPGARARVREYGGRGPIEHWVRVAATRRALNLCRGAVRELPFEEAFFRSQPDFADLEAQWVDGRYAQPVRDAVRRGMAGLGPRDQALLWFALVDGQPAEQIAKIYAVHRTTASRWIVRAASDLRAAVEAELCVDEGLRASELSSIVRTVLARAASGLS